MGSKKERIFYWEFWLIVGPIALYLFLQHSEYSNFTEREYSWQAIRPADLSWKYEGDNSEDLQSWTEATATLYLPKDDDGTTDNTLDCFISPTKIVSEQFPSIEDIRSDKRLFAYARFHYDLSFSTPSCSLGILNTESWFRTHYENDFSRLTQDLIYDTASNLKKYRMQRDKISFWEYLKSNPNPFS